MTDNFVNREDSVDAVAPTAEKYLLKLNDLCRSNDVTLILMVIPTLHSSGLQKSFDEVKVLADEQGIPFINGYEDNGHWGLDYATDFFDFAHVNLRGSEKISKYIGRYLSNNFDIPGHWGDRAYDVWNEDYEEYNDFKKSVYTYPTYSFGDIITFGSGGSGEDYFVSGLEETEEEVAFSWSEGKRSDAFFYLNSSKDISLRCCISYVQPLFSTNIRNVEIYFNENLIGKLELDSKVQDIEAEFAISNNQIVNGQLQHLYFKYGGVDDLQYVPRTIAFKSIEFIQK